jgi:hypothetical protein
VRFLLYFLLLASYAYSLVSVKVNKDNITLGESVQYTITAIGGDVVFPDIVEVGEYQVEAVSTSQSINIINGSQTKRVSKTYRFTPSRDITIPIYSVNIDNKKQHTQPIKIKVSKVSKERDFILDLVFDKKEAFVNELVRAKLILKIDKNKDFSNIGIMKLPFDDFWVKDVAKERRLDSDKYNIIEKEYLLFAQKDGKIDIDSAIVSVITSVIGQDYFGFTVSKSIERKVYSNENSIKIRALPNGIEHVGEFDIDISVDKKSVQANKPINLEIKITADTNIDDIDTIDLNIKNANIFKDEPKREYRYKDGKLKATFSQKIAIVSDKSYSIEPIEFRYLSLKDNKIKVVSTKRLHIDVITANKNDIAKIEKFDTDKSSTKKESKEIVTLDDNSKYLYIAIGFMVAVVLLIIYILIKKYLYKSIKNLVEVNSDKDTLKMLLPKIKEPIVADAVKKLEENIYEGKKHKIILPKELIELDKKENNI